MVSAGLQGIEDGVIRADLSWEHMQRFFDMALRMYVDNAGPRDSDVEIGIHMRQCPSPLCGRMTQAYFELLKPSTDEESEQVYRGLVGVARELFIGTERTDLKGTLSGFYDSDTGKSLLIVKAVDITPKCVLNISDEVQLVYSKPKKGMMVNIQERREGEVSSQILYGLNTSTFAPEDEVFRRTADMIGVDPQILYTIIRVNAPQASQRGKVISDLPLLLG